MLSEPVRAFLSEPRFAVLSTINPDGSSQQSVMWYRLQDDMVMMNTRAGRVKDENIRRDPRISICIADGYRYVTLSGRAELDDDQQVAQADIAALARYYNRAGMVDHQIVQFQREHRVTIRMSIERVVASGFS